jgi:mono/diheme cytochrome c family protein
VNKITKRFGVALGGIVVVGLALLGAASIAAHARLGKHYQTHRIELPLPVGSDAAAIERGKHLVTARYGCAACHGQNLAGGVMIDDAAIGEVRGPNLTAGKGSRSAKYTMADWDRIVRHGVKPDGTPAVMPSDDFFKMSDAELSDIVAYVRSVPPVDAEVKAPSFGPIGNVLLALGKLPLSAERTAPAVHPSVPPAAADNAQFGEHLAATCVTCHRQNLAGGPMAFGPPSWPAAANLTPHATGLRDWTFDDFDKALTRGSSKDGHLLRSPMAEVVQGTQAMDVTERKALWTYLRQVSAAPTNPG